MDVNGGDTNVTTYFALRKTSDGTAATGLTIANIDLQYVRSGIAPVAKVDATALAATDSVHADNKAIEIDATDQPGLYRVDWPDAAFATGVREVVLTVKVATAFTEHLRVQIDQPVNVLKVSGSAEDIATATALAIVDGNVDDIETIVNAILIDTDELQGDWTDGGRLDIILDAILLDTGEIGLAGIGLTDLGGMSTSMKGEVNAQVKDVIFTDTQAQPGQGSLAATQTLILMVAYIYKFIRNKTTQTKGVGAELNIFNDDTVTVDHKAGVSDDGTTATINEIQTGP